MSLELSIESWTEEHARFEELKQVIEVEGQMSWFSFKVDWHLEKHTLVALWHDKVIGFLYFAVQEIGPELERPSVKLKGVALTEAKILAFGVVSDMRGKGVGRRLQQEAIELARALHCHQIRSHSSGSSHANHHLKLSMGFAIDPIIRDEGLDNEDREGGYFLMPLFPTNTN